MAIRQELPLSLVSGGADAGFLSGIILAALIDLLIEKEAITQGEIVFLLQSLNERLGKDTRAISKRTADTLGKWIHAQEALQKAHGSP